MYNFDVIAFFNAFVYAHFDFYIGEKIESKVRQNKKFDNHIILVNCMMILLNCIGIHLLQKYVKLYMSAACLAMGAYSIKTLIDIILAKGRAQR